MDLRGQILKATGGRVHLSRRIWQTLLQKIMKRQTSLVRQRHPNLTGPTHLHLGGQSPTETPVEHPQGRVMPKTLTHIKSKPLTLPGRLVTVTLEAAVLPKSGPP